MKVKATFKVPTLNFDRFKNKVHQELSDAIAYGAFEWINAAVSKIPVWSGASHATFLQLAKAIGFHLSINPVAAIKDTNLGIEYGFGDFTTDMSTGKYSFEYATTLEHLIFNEYQNANGGADPNVFYRLKDPGPYGFQEFANEAFKKAVAEVHLPSFLPYLKMKTYRV